MRNWSFALREFFAVFKKEAICEFRTRTGLFSSGLFAVVSTSAISIASIQSPPDATMAAALLYVALAFAAVTGLTRAYAVEEDQRTGDLLRLLASPDAVFWGKLAFNYLLLMSLAAIVVPLHIVFSRIEVQNPGLLCVAVIVGCTTLCAAVSFCGAIVARSTARGTVAGVISLPILLPVIVSGIGSVRVAFGFDIGNAESVAWQSVLSLAGLALAFIAVGRLLFSFIWK
ncbi:MAG: heme exporter protein CcmB [Fimbriimonadales bacterium]